MARCEDCIHGEICRFICYTRTVLVGGNAEKRCKYFKPAADVVPKSEVEELRVELAAMRTAANSFKMHYENLAREIIADFDEELHKLAERYYEQGKIDYFTLCEVIYNLVIAKVKKKYTEEPSV